MDRGDQREKIEIKIHIPDGEQSVLSIFYILPYVLAPDKECQHATAISRLSLESFFNGAIPSSTDDPVIDHLARSWLMKCITEHKTCDRDRDRNWYPARLLDVTRPEPRLVLTKDEKPEGPYATLSHCWGLNLTHITLKASTLAKSQDSVPLSEMPKNFCDAIHVAKWLDLKYVWIDSLCIIQGD
jgi:hypothetical protein